MADSESTKYARKVYFGNLASSSVESKLREEVRHILVDYGGIVLPGDPIVCSLFVEEPRSLYLEFRTVEEAEAALTLNGMEF